MFSPKILALAFTMAPSLVFAALFPPDSLVKMIDAKGFRKAMKANVGFHSFFLENADYYSGNKCCGFCCTLVWCTSQGCFNTTPDLPLKIALPKDGSGI